VRVSAEERRTILKLLNVSEAARQLGVGIQQLHRDIRAGRVQSPQIRLGRRVYFSHDEMKQLATQYDEGEKR